MLNQCQFLRAGQPFDGSLPLQGSGAVGAQFAVNRGYRAAATGIFGTLAAAVSFQPLFHIGGDAGVQRAVPAAEDV